MTRMTIGFPNLSRSFDSARRAVRFWGHDRAMEAQFVVTEDALLSVQPDASLDEAGLLHAFDANRDLIHATAAKAYERDPGGAHLLTALSFTARDGASKPLSFRSLMRRG